MLEGVYPTATHDPIHSVYVSLVLGGGYGYLTGEHGLSIDNLVQVRHITHYLVYYLTSA